MNPVAPPVVVLDVEEEFEEALDWMLATWVPAKAKKRNMVVPTNSPIVATKSGGVSWVWGGQGRGGDSRFLTLLFIHCVQGSLITSARSSLVRFLKSIVAFLGLLFAS